MIERTVDLVAKTRFRSSGVAGGKEAEGGAARASRATAAAEGARVYCRPEKDAGAAIAPLAGSGGEIGFCWERSGGKYASYGFVRYLCAEAGSKLYSICLRLL